MQRSSNVRGFRAHAHLQYRPKLLAFQFYVRIKTLFCFYCDLLASVILHCSVNWCYYFQISLSNCEHFASLTFSVFCIKIFFLMFHSHLPIRICLTKFFGGRSYHHYDFLLDQRLILEPNYYIEKLSLLL